MGPREDKDARSEGFTDEQADEVDADYEAEERFWNPPDEEDEAA